MGIILHTYSNLDICVVHNIIIVYNGCTVYEQAFPRSSQIGLKNILYFLFIILIIIICDKHLIGLHFRLPTNCRCI